MRSVAFSRWDPLHDLLALHERLNRLGVDDAPGWTPAVDLYETADRFVLSLELPGLTRDHIKIEMQQETLIVRGERAVPARGRRAVPPRGAGPRRVRAVVRAAAAGGRRAVEAEFRDGVLTVVVPKVAPQHAPRRHRGMP